MLETRTELVAGRRLRVARLGAGEPLLLLHGYPDNLQIFSAVAPLLSARFEVIAFDWPGMGQSEAWPGGTTPWHLAERLLALLDAWQLPPVNLLGMDMGAQPALVLAAEHPDRVTRLAVSNALVFPDGKTSWEIALLRRFGWNRVLIRRFPWLVFRRAVGTFLPAGQRLPDELRRDLWTSFRRSEVLSFVSKMCAGYQGTLPKLPALYGGITRPTLVLWGERDRHFPEVQGRRLAAAIPDARLEVVPGGEHWMVLSRPGEVAASLVEFLTSPA